MQEVANPLVRDQLHFYPEDSGPRLCEARQANRWLHEVSPNFAAPMVRTADGQDFFVEEPALALTQTPSGTAHQVVLPVRFFERADKMFATVHRMSVSASGTGLIIEACNNDDSFDLPISALFLNFPRLMTSHNRYRLPRPDQINGQSRARN